MSSFATEFTVLEEILEPKSMKMRLIEGTRSKNIAIQTWGSMQGEWITTQRYTDVQGMWNKSKALANILVNGR
jgi:hypothetical protein